MKNHTEEIAYWFFSKHLHLNEDNYGSGYYGFQIMDRIVRHLKKSIPDQGQIVMLGTHNCHSFQILCDVFGPERCVGYDLYNPTQHPRVIVKDILTLSDTDRFPMAFCYNDISSFPRDSVAKIYAQRWSAPALVKGGVYLGRNNLNRAQYKSEQEMEEWGYSNFSFDDFLLKNSFDPTQFSNAVREGHLFSIKN